MTPRVVLGHDLVELLGVLGSAQVAVVGDCVLGQTMVTCSSDEGQDNGVRTEYLRNEYL